MPLVKVIDPPGWQVRHGGRALAPERAER